MATTQSNLPTVQRLKYEDYSRYSTWQQAFQGLIASLNLFMNPVYDILNGNVTYTNLTVPKTFTKIITAASTTTFSFVNPLTISPSAVIIGNVWTGIPSAHPTGNVDIYWHYSGNTIFVDNIIGLTSGTNYNITLVVL